METVYVNTRCHARYPNDNHGGGKGIRRCNLASTKKVEIDLG
jgi:hypothetical protein